ncbi:hypothetical protein ACHQM5_021285 [Ranunculus cassubicifolius]
MELQNGTQGENQHVIQINQDHLTSMEEKILAMPKILSTSAGKSSCFIFRVPQSKVQLDRHAYYPSLVSIGPYHLGEKQLAMIQEHKWRFLGSLLSRTRNKGLVLEDYLKAIKEIENRARDSYSEIIDLNSDEFAAMMVLDGCFIIEFFRYTCEIVKTEANDPLFAMSWVMPFVLRDFIKLENQIPFFVLQTLFSLSEFPEQENRASYLESLASSLVKLAMESFGIVANIPAENIEQFDNVNGKHLLGLVRSRFIPNTTQSKIPPKHRARSLIRSRFIPNTQTEKSTKPNLPPEMIHCVSKLRRAGIRFKVDEDQNRSFLDIKYHRGVIEMPKVTIDDFTSCLFLNCVAFEQSYTHCSKHFTTYASLMDCLMNTYSDVEFLCDERIIENYLGTDGEVSKFFNNLGRDVGIDINKFYLAGLFDEVNRYYRNDFHVQWAELRYTYFRTPWSFLSALAAVILLILTVAQTFYTVYQYHRPPKQ